MRDPFRKGLGYAIQWYDNLKVRIEERVEAAIVAADEELESAKVPDKPKPIPSDGLPDSSPPKVPDKPKPIPSDGLPDSSPQPTSSDPLTECARILRQRCPACFGGTNFGKTFNEGGDIHVCIDGNFNHRHLISSGDCPKFYDPEYFLPKSQIDDAGHRIELVRKKKPKKVTPEVPNEAVDECETSHVAGSGSNSKTNMEKFDDGGVMALVCRHDIPLFLANIDTPGEQQKYGVALLMHLFTLIPRSATVAALYDVGCVLDRSSKLYDIFPDSMTDRLQFATSAMHAYVHQWACQLVYNPRLRVGLGLTDGEGVERLWSRLRKLVGITRTSHRGRRIWMLDRQVRLIGLEHRDDLGLWIHRRLSKGVEGQDEAARKTLLECNIPESTLRAQWELQRKSQLSLRAHAPVRLKKELDTVLSLQGELDSIDEAIGKMKTEFSRTSSVPKQALASLASLQALQAELKDQSETLYASLNVHESFPELKTVDLEFVRLLLTARDLKINIRKRAIGSFLEWDKLDQAVAGRDQTLGTKLHQATRKAISKRKPALMNAIRKFNGYCVRLAALHKTEWNLPVPQPLPLDLASLRESPLLHEDVWITKSEGNLPLWLKDAQVRQGIRALLKRDRCLEERRRLGVEADNLCRWFGRELCAIQVALNSPLINLSEPTSDSSIFMILKQRRDHLLSLKDSWSSALASTCRFDSHVKSAASLTSNDSSRAKNPSLTWLTPLTTTHCSTQALCVVEDLDDVDDLDDLDSCETPSSSLLSSELHHTPDSVHFDDETPPELLDLLEAAEVNHDDVVDLVSPKVFVQWALP
ncbi:hypothetical protein H0H93_008564, partial [Arthromyces matolae]